MLGCVVYGTGYTNHFGVVRKRATTVEERDEFKGSKYTQSDITGMFRQVKKDLQDRLTVIFSELPARLPVLPHISASNCMRVYWVNFSDKQKYGRTAYNETFKFVNGGKRWNLHFCFTGTSYSANHLEIAIYAKHVVPAT